MTNYESNLVGMFRVREIDSTNNYLSEICQNDRVKEFTLVSTAYQTAGKGQRGNHWESEFGKNLLCSILLYPDFLKASKQFLLSKMIALSIKEVLDTFEQGFLIKWPNDIYWGEKKIGGILIENDIVGNVLSRSIIGVGINVNQKQFPDFVPNPISLCEITGKEHDCPLEILDAILGRLKQYYGLLKEGKTEEIEKKYHDALFRKEGMYLYKDSSGEFPARIVHVEPEGLLVLEDEKGNERKYAFKEVSAILGSGN